MNEEIKDIDHTENKDEKMEAIGHNVGSFFAWTITLCLSVLAIATTVKIVTWMLM